MRILIADDDPLQREVLQGFLEKQGYAVLSAGDGAQALRLFRREPATGAARSAYAGTERRSGPGGDEGA